MRKRTSFAETVLRHVDPKAKFQPIATYDRDGDCLEFLAKPDPFYAERIDDLVTVYYSQETKEIIGSIIKGVSRFQRELLKTCPGFIIEVHDGRVHLSHLFLARLWTLRDVSPEDLKVITYQKLMKVAEEAKAEAAMSFA
jgi:hypothetical protein